MQSLQVCTASRCSSSRCRNFLTEHILIKRFMYNTHTQKNSIRGKKLARKYSRREVNCLIAESQNLKPRRTSDISKSNISHWTLDLRISLQNGFHCQTDLGFAEQYTSSQIFRLSIQALQVLKSLAIKKYYLTHCCPNIFDFFISFLSSKNSVSSCRSCSRNADLVQSFNE